MWQLKLMFSIDKCVSGEFHHKIVVDVKFQQGQHTKYSIHSR